MERDSLSTLSSACSEFFINAANVFPELDISAPVEAALTEEHYCFENENFSRRFVDATISEALNAIESKTKKSESVEIIEPVAEKTIKNVLEPKQNAILYGKKVTDCYNKNDNKNTCNYYESEGFSGWPKISEFNIKLGLERVEDFVDTWKRSPEWKFCVEFLGFESEDCSNYFIYEVEWSIPTSMHPIPQATASVYFSLEVSKMVPHSHDRMIEVTCIFETSTLAHLPGKVDFQEKWLTDIIEAKLKTFKTIAF